MGLKSAVSLTGSSFTPSLCIRIRSCNTESPGAVCSGRDTDKAAKVGLTMQEVEGTNIKAPVPCKLLIHATVAQTMDADDHVVHLCDVKGVYGDEDVNAVFGWKGYAEFAAAQQK